MQSRTRTMTALLVLLTMLAVPPALAQQEAAGDPSEEGASQAAADTAYGVPLVAAYPAGSSTEEAYPQYAAVPPGYERVGDAYCPTFDPHGPPCFPAP